jgi:hypothetical protein
MAVRLTNDLFNKFNKDNRGCNRFDKERNECNAVRELLSIIIRFLVGNLDSAEEIERNVSKDEERCHLFSPAPQI